MQIHLYAGESSSPIATTVGTGRGDGVLGPFEATIDWPSGTSGSGVLMLLAHNEDDGSVWDVAAITVELP